MCVFGSGAATPDDPRLPVEYAAQRSPDNQQVESAGNRTKDRLRAATSTVLTGANGVGAVDPSGKKVLLGA
jgi:riboflavin biosynthesis pyrimidine reductase